MLVGTIIAGDGPMVGMSFRLVTSMTWDKDGDVLALTNDKTTAVTLWEVGTKKTETLDANMGSK